MQRSEFMRLCRVPFKAIWFLLFLACCFSSQAQTFTNKTTSNTSNGLGSNLVFRVFASGSTVFAATANGLSISTDGGNTYTNKTMDHGLGDNYVTSVFAIDNTIYAATAGGLGISNDGGASFTNKTMSNGLGSNEITDVIAVGDRVYAATGNGLGISTDGGNTFTNKTTTNGLGNNTIRGVFAIGQKVYVATYDGLSISTNGGDTFTNKTTEDGLGSNFLNGVYASGSSVYVATNIAGIAISTDGGNTFTNKNTSSGLGNNKVVSVFASGNNVYAATDGGLSISFDGGDTYANMTTSSGLGTNTVRGVYVNGNTVYVATFSGLSISGFGAVSTPSSIYVNGTSTLNTIGGSGTGDVSFTLVSGPCSLSGSTLTGTGLGTCNVTATKADDGTYASVTSSQLTVAVLATQASLEFSPPPPSSIEVNESTQLNATGGSGTGMLSYTLVSGPCTFSNQELIGTGAGTCVVVATKAADSTYAATSTQVTVTVGGSVTDSPLTQNSLYVSASLSSIVVNGSSTLSTTGGSGTGAVSYSVSGPCSLSGSTLTGTGAGTCVVTATKAADSTYAAATATVNITVSQPAPAVISIAPKSGITLGGSVITITGSNLDGAAAITVGGVACSTFSVISSTTATCTTPAGSAGKTSVVVTTPGGSSNSPFVISSTLSNLNGSNGFRLDGVAGGELSGFSVAPAGDVNGDGYADIIISAYYADPSGADSGSSYLVFGKANGFDSTFNLSSLDGSNGFRLDGAASGDWSGYSVAAAGDVNGDGYADIIIGAPFSANSGGSSYVVFGKASGFAASVNLTSLNGSNGFRLDGVAVSDLSAASVASAGDVNGDGYADIIIGAFGADTNDSDSGASYVVFGKAGGFAASINLSSLNGTNGFRIDGVSAGEASGVSVASAGDVNGDGYADVIIGAPFADHNGIDAAGLSYVVFGKASGFAASINLSSLDGSNGFRLEGVALGDLSGLSVASAGDVNRDGYADIIIGAPGADPNGWESGSSYVVFGKAGGFASSINLSSLNGSNGFRIDGVANDDRSGSSVASAGDVNGDGYADVIIGAPGATPNGPDSGSSYVVFGKASGFAASINLASLDGSDGFRVNGVAVGDRSGSSVASAGDVNGDGNSDIIIGAFRAGTNGSDSGSSYVVFGKSDMFTYVLPQSTLVAAASLSSINVNGDATLSTTGGSGTGAVSYSVSGPCTLSGATLTGTGAGTCVVTATKAADSTYAAATSSQLTVNITVASIPSVTTVGAGSSVSLGSLGANASPVLSGGTLTLASGNSSNASISVTGSGGTIQAPTSGSATLSGIFSGSGGLTFTGTGRTVLSGTNTFSGGTTVSSGTLVVSGSSPTGTGDVFVASGGTLMGTGTIAGNTTLSGIFKPGNSPGFLSMLQNLTLDSGAVFVEDIAGTTQASSSTPVGASTYYAFTSVGGQMVINSGVTLTPRLSNLFSLGEPGFNSPIYVPVLGDVFRMVTAAGGVTGRFATLTQPAEMASGTQLLAFYNVNNSNSLDLAVVPTSYTASLAGSMPAVVSAAAVLDQWVALNQAGTLGAVQNQRLFGVASQTNSNLAAYVQAHLAEILVTDRAPIPTLNEWAMILLVSLMGMLGLVRMRHDRLHGLATLNKAGLWNFMKS